MLHCALRYRVLFCSIKFIQHLESFQHYVSFSQDCNMFLPLYGSYLSSAGAFSIIIYSCFSLSLDTYWTPNSEIPSSLAIACYQSPSAWRISTLAFCSIDNWIFLAIFKRNFIMSKLIKVSEKKYILEILI
jgi:hypothetical protein